MAIKSERVVPLSAQTISPAPGGYICSQGVQLARQGQDDPLIALPVAYKMPLPFANVVVAGGTGGTVVMAFPFSLAQQGPLLPSNIPPTLRFTKKMKRTSGSAGDRRS